MVRSAFHESLVQDKAFVNAVKDVEVAGWRLASFALGRWCENDPSKLIEIKVAVDSHAAQEPLGVVMRPRQTHIESQGFERVAAVYDSLADIS